jgi:hypothetical protein
MDFVIETDLRQDDPRRCPGSNQPIQANLVNIGSRWTAICRACELRSDVTLSGRLGFGVWSFVPHPVPDNAAHQSAVR